MRMTLKHHNGMKKYHIQQGGQGERQKEEDYQPQNNTFEIEAGEPPLLFGGCAFSFAPRFSYCHHSSLIPLEYSNYFFLASTYSANVLRMERLLPSSTNPSR